jgi:ribonuclease HI
MDSRGRSEPPKIILNFDGLCEPKNPGGVATYGVIISRGGEKLLAEGGLADAEPYTDSASNNVAEYSALIRGLSWLLERGLRHEPVVIRGDSRLVLNQLNGQFKVKALRLVELYQRAKELLSQFDNVHLEWVDRSQNAEADLFSRIAYSKFLREKRSSS